MKGEGMQKHYGHFIFKRLPFVLLYQRSTVWQLCKETVLLLLASVPAERSVFNFCIYLLALYFYSVAAWG
jgi:hypothetical protein